MFLKDTLEKKPSYVVHARNLSDSVVETNIKNELSKFGLIRYIIILQLAVNIKRQRFISSL